MARAGGRDRAGASPSIGRAASSNSLEEIRVVTTLCHKRVGRRANAKKIFEFHRALWKRTLAHARAAMSRRTCAPVKEMESTTS